MNTFSTRPLVIGDTTIELKRAGTNFLGLGEISVDGVKLRRGSVPMLAKVRTPDGVELVDMTLGETSATGDGLVLSLGAAARPGALMEWMLHECRPRVATEAWGEAPQPVEDLQFSLTLTPAARDFGPHAARGFCYQYAYACPSRPIYMITDYATWEVGGSALGNTIAQRGAVRTIADLDELYSTEWYLPGITNPNIFQFKPFQTALQGFTLTLGPGGALLTWATEVAHIRTLLQKQRGAAEIEHWHEHCADLGPELTTSPMEVLWIPGDFTTAAALANLYFHITEVIYPELHRQAGLRRERIKPYGTIEEWELPDLEHYTQNGLPKLLDAGVKTVFLANMFENNMNTYGVGNMCCTVDYRIAETVGKAKVKAFCDRARAAGAEVQMWGNTAISDLAWKCSQRNGAKQRIDFLPLEGSIMDVLKTAATPFVRNAFGAMEADHYSPVFCQLNLRDQTVRDYWHKCWRDAHEQIGIDGIFLDSSFNMSSDKFHWSYWPDGAQKGATIDQTHLHGHQRPASEPQPQILSQYHAHLSLMAEMQCYGYHYCAEDVGVFGLHRSGPDVVKRLDHLFMWFDGYCQFDPQAVLDAGEDPDRVFFLGLAYRVMWNLFWDIDNDELTWGHCSSKTPLDPPTAPQLRLLQIYSEVEADMVNREVLADEAAVLYAGPDNLIVWAAEPVALALESAGRIEDLVRGDTITAGGWQAEARHVYRVPGGVVKPSSPRIEAEQYA